VLAHFFGGINFVTTTNSTTKTQWTNTQAIALAVASLLIGTGGGFLLRRSLSLSNPSTGAISPSPIGAKAAPTAASANNLNASVDIQTAAKIEQLKSDPNNVGILVELGNLYYDDKQYPSAIEYYKRALALQPANTNVRTDLGTAYWYMGNADNAISEFNKSLTYEPTKVDTLFNLGIVQFKGKKDSSSAIATWQKLLATNPLYEHKDKVQKLIAEAQASR
jgi:tetratricopeptide (TPR) repeat protein